MVFVKFRWISMDYDGLRWISDVFVGAGLFSVGYPVFAWVVLVFEYVCPCLTLLLAFFFTSGRSGRLAVPFGYLLSHGRAEGGGGREQEETAG